MADLKFHQKWSLFLSSSLYLLLLVSIPQETDRPIFPYDSLQNLYILAVQNPLFSLTQVLKESHIWHFQVWCDPTCSTRSSSSPLKWIGLNCNFFLAYFGVNLNDIYPHMCVTSPVKNWLPKWWVIDPPYPLL